MTTPYSGREDEHDLGNGYSFYWLSDAEGVIGLIEHHPRPTEDKPNGICGGYIAWEQRHVPPPKHRLVAGGPGDEEHLTIEPSLLCRCGEHGFIREGKWVSV